MEVDIDQPTIASRTCALCGRTDIRTTRHHLVPRMRHRQKRTRRAFTREQRQQTVDLCVPCHGHIHAVLTEKQLADEYHTLEALRRHEEVRRFAEWIASKPVGLRVQTRRKR